MKKNKRIGFPYTYGDFLSEEAAIQNIKDEFNQTRTYSKSFSAGLIAGIVFSGNIVHAIDKPTKVGVKETAKRGSNALGCGVITAICGKAVPSTAGKEAAKQAATANPKVVAAFACGFAIGWCVKYVVFDE
jgi:hypothetical protein